MRLLIIGGYGVFGSQVARELAEAGIPVVIAGRDLAKASAHAAKLGPAHQAARIDLLNRTSCEDAVRGCQIVVNCAGPFQNQDDTLLKACLAEGCHYVDIADDPGYVQRVQRLDGAFRDRGISAVYGCSSLPAISGALALSAQDPAQGPLKHVRVTLFIGNRNPKGAGAVQSLLGALGSPISAPQGTLRVFHDGEVIPLPRPFGPRRCYNFNSPDFQLLPSLLKTPSVGVKVGFELSFVNRAFALLALFTTRGVGPFARIMASMGSVVGGFGRSGGIVMSELFYADGASRSAACVADESGQRMAIIPCVYVIETLLNGSVHRPGTFTAYDWDGPQPLLERLKSASYRLVAAGVQACPNE